MSALIEATLTDICCGFPLYFHETERIQEVQFKTEPRLAASVAALYSLIQCTATPRHTQGLRSAELYSSLILR